YNYYTPEQVDKLVYDAVKELNLFIKFDLKRNEFGIEGELTVMDLDNDSNDNHAIFTMASDIPSIKATNISQQLGGSMTYTKRYMLMNVFDIINNNLDYDNTDNTQKSQSNKKESPELWLNKYDKKENELADYWTIVKRAKSQNKTVKDLREFYKISKVVAAELEIDLKWTSFVDERIKEQKSLMPN
ncbi:MAG: hypothetical protein GY679_00935, partial [Mycoplasma sp.]|nr:hypothetical protein [Mycoplasma sp.]